MNYVWEDYSSKYSEKIEAFLDSEAIKYTGCEDGFDNFYSYWKEELGANFWCKVILIENEPIAIIAFAKAPDNIFTIQEFIVSPNNRGKGYGSAILKELLAHSKKIIGQDIFVAKAVIYPDNKASQRVFEKASFIHTGTHPDGDALYFQCCDVKIKNCLICKRIEMIKNNENPYFVKELETGYVVLGDHQRFKGYTLFLCKKHTTELHYLDHNFKMKYLEEMSLVAEAVQNTFSAEKMNYELLGNGDTHLHWHLFPRNTGDTLEKGPVWWLPKEELWNDKYKPTDNELLMYKNKLLQKIDKLLQKYNG